MSVIEINSDPQCPALHAYRGELVQCEYTTTDGHKIHEWSEPHGGGGWVEWTDGARLADKILALHHPSGSAPGTICPICYCTYPCKTAQLALEDS